MTSDLRDRWNRRYRAATVQGAQASAVLAENLHLLPTEGDALDLASGMGADACVLARHRLRTVAWDLSDVAVRLLAAHAGEQTLPLTAETRDVIAHPPPSARFDVIVVSAFLHRALCPAIMQALRPGGLLFYQTHCQKAVRPGGPSNPDFLLDDGELLELFCGLRPVVYREERLLGDTFRGFRDRAMLVALKP